MSENKQTNEPLVPDVIIKESWEGVIAILKPQQQPPQHQDNKKD
ncbi:hypothetical protein [Photobacterium kishitanii]|nr:hypothetical protein [Photobacterium kishitanii]